jgi:uncharacterized protein YjiS (DUF1127 family)
MSTSFADGSLPSLTACSAVTLGHQSNSWPGLLSWLLTRSEIMHQRAALGEIADDPHMLRDLGLTREEALEHANRPFWR